MSDGKISISGLLGNDGFECSCGKKHFAKVKDVIIESGAINRIPEMIKKYSGTRAFVLADENTLSAAGNAVIAVLKNAGINYSLYVFPEKRPEPDEKAVGAAVMNFDYSCDIIVSVGSGVINDTGKILARMTKLPYIVVGTAPSMDGYSSATSSMARGGLKVSLDSKCPDAVIGDLDILCNAPMRMIQAGLGDMLAKYISICEWRISHIINGEYYCDYVAGLIKTALDECVKNADGVLKRDKNAVKAIMEGMVIAGIAANYAGLSRPVSGMEHYFSHIWDMRAVAFGTPSDLHGIQCGIGTLYSLKIYEKIRDIVPDREKALSYVKSFDYSEWKKFLSEKLGDGALAMFANEEKEHKYDAQKHKERLEIILSNWDKIIGIINYELPSYNDVYTLMKKIGAPTDISEFGLTAADAKDAFLMTKDIRNKYIASHLLFDIGCIDETAAEIFR